MKILNIVSAKIWGGGEQYVYDVCREMTKRNIENYVLVDKRNTSLQERFSKVSKVLFANLYSFNGMMAFNEILTFIDTYNINIVNCHSGKMMPLCLLIKKFRNIKIVLFKHNATKSKEDFYHKYMRNNTDAIICVSNLVYNLQIEGLSDFEKQKYHIVHNGILIERFEKHKRVVKDENRFIIGYAGRITENKGIGVLLKAVKNLHELHNNIEFNFVGADEGDYLNQLQSEIAINGMMGYAKYNGLETDMEKFYKSIDVLVLPSIVREAFGLVICEAMYCGVLVISSNSGAQNEIIEDGVDGLILDYINEDCLTSRILDIYDEKINVSSLINKAKKKIKNHFSVVNTVDKLINIYHKL